MNQLDFLRLAKTNEGLTHRARRIAADLTQEQVADYIGCKRLRVVRNEQGTGGGYSVGETELLNMLYGYPDMQLIPPRRQALELAYTEAYSKRALGIPIEIDNLIVDDISACSLDGKYILICAQDSNRDGQDGDEYVQLVLDARTGTVLARWSNSDDDAIFGCFSPDSQEIAFSIRDGRGVCVWKWQSGNAIRHYISDSYDGVTGSGAAFLDWKDNHIFVYFEDQAILQRWCLVTGESEIFTLYQTLTGEPAEGPNGLGELGEYGIGKMMALDIDEIIIVGFWGKSHHIKLGSQNQRDNTGGLGLREKYKDILYWSGTVDDGPLELYALSGQDNVVNVVWDLKYRHISQSSWIHFPTGNSPRLLSYIPEHYQLLGLTYDIGSRTDGTTSLLSIRDFSSGQVVVVAQSDTPYYINPGFKLSPRGDWVCYVKENIYGRRLEESARRSTKIVIQPIDMGKIARGQINHILDSKRSLELLIQNS